MIIMIIIIMMIIIIKMIIKIVIIIIMIIMIIIMIIIIVASCTIAASKTQYRYARSLEKGVRMPIRIHCRGYGYQYGSVPHSICIPFRPPS